MEIIILMSWAIWTSRNNYIFKNENVYVEGAQGFSKEEFAMVIHRAKPKYFPIPIVVQWLDNLV
jgi:hypothetical protein